MSTKKRTQSSGTAASPPKKLKNTKKNMDKIGPIDPLLVGRAHVVYERGEQTVPLL
ncbi:MAG: hypothetical protein QF918_15645 [Pirellulaceae bacterium]|nr:hypothetical protein [Pirellulaceae bacterium]